MGKIIRNFTAGKMNKSLDERLIPNGEYVDALNVRMGSTEQAEIGVIENSKGNTQLTTLKYNNISLSANAKCIGAFEDGALETIYWFVHDSSFSSSPTGKLDMIVSFNTTQSIITYHVISIADPNDSTATKTTLNFDPEFLITGVNKVENLLFFTDDYNPPRQINVTTNYPNPNATEDLTSAESLLVIKKPPINSPKVFPISTSTQDNFLETRFISFAYRYRYEDGEYSATSQFSEPSFIPKPFTYSNITALNEGMVNSTNQCNIIYNSGGPLVKSVDLLFKDMNSSVIKVIEKLNKLKDGLADDTEYTYTFNNSKIFTVLPSSEILRLFDGVPKLAQSQTLMGNRITYGNYLENYDLQRNKVPTKLEYIVNQENIEIGSKDVSSSLSSSTYTFDTGTQNIPNSQVDIDFSGLDLKQGASFGILLRFEHNSFSGNTPFPTETTSSVNITFNYILPTSFSSVFDLATSLDFVEKIGNITNISTVANSCLGATYTDLFNCNVTNELSGTTPVFKFESGISAAGQPINIISSTSSSVLSLQLPAMKFVDDPTNITFTVFEYYKITLNDVSFQEIGNPTSLHSNRGYEIGIIYMDEFNRMTTALVSPNNTAHIACSESENQNTLNVTIPTTQVGPEWATRYKFCIKPDKKDYNTIYANLFFRDASSGNDFFLLEGQNSQKIQEGDEMIVKVDTSGPRNVCTFTTVLAKSTEFKDFLNPKPVDSQGTEIPVPAGVYMKIRANNFSTEVGDLPVVDYGEYRERGNGCKVIRYPVDTPDTSTPGNFVDYTIPAGSRITIDIENFRRGAQSVPERFFRVEQTLTASQDYTNFKNWFDGDNVAAALEANATESQPDVGLNYLPNNNSLPVGCNYSQMFACFEVQNAGTANQRTFLRFQSSQGYGPNSGKGPNARKNIILAVKIQVIRASGLIVFESLPQDAEPDLWYESSESYAIDSIGQHQSDLQSQVFATNTPAVIKTDFFNCFAFGNGVESYKIQDSVIGKPLVLGNRATTTDSKEYSETRRFADLTYSGVYNAESNINKLNEFNTGLLNFKALEQEFGPVMKLQARETDILVLQEDKISYVLAGKNLLSDAGAGNSLTSVPEVLGTQIARIEEYGISANPESFSQYGPHKYFTDAKRGTVIQLSGTSYSNDSLSPISEFGMRSWFRDLFQDAFTTQKLGGFDPYMKEYVLSSNSRSIPLKTPCIECGLTKTINITTSNGFDVCYDLGAFVGPVDIDYSVEASSLVSTFRIDATYKGTTNTTGDVNTGGTLTFNKSTVLDNEVSIQATSFGSATITLTVKCPSAETINIYLIHVSSTVDTGLQTTDEYRWEDGVFVSPLHTESVVFNTGTFPIVSLFDTITGPQGGGVIPTNGSTVTMLSNKIGTDDYNFSVSSDKFKYLRTDTNYANNSSDILSLIAASAVATPINVPSQGNTAFSADFIMPSVGSNLYLLWDFRDSTAVDLCFGATINDACCGCEGIEPAAPVWILSDCVTGNFRKVTDTFSVYSLFDVVQYQMTAGGTIFCGTIITLDNGNYPTAPSATLYSTGATFNCGDETNCNI